MLLSLLQIARALYNYYSTQILLDFHKLPQHFLDKSIRKGFKRDKEVTMSAYICTERKTFELSFK